MKYTKTEAKEALDAMLAIADNLLYTGAMLSEEYDDFTDLYSELNEYIKGIEE